MAFVYDEQTGRFVDDSPSVGMPPPQAPEESGFLRRTVGDAATSVAKGVLVGIPQAAVGLANIATLGMAEKPLGAIGDSISAMGERIDKKYSTQHQQQAEEVADTKGFLPTIGAVISRPGYLVDTALEMLPTMFGGAKLGQALGKSGALGESVATGYAEGASTAARTAAATTAAAVGEGAVTAGQTAEQIRQEDPNGETSFGQRAAATAAGVVTGALTFGAGKLASKLGIATPETYFAGAPGAETAGKLAADGTRMEFTHAPGTLSRIGRGVLAEGVFEELPQSMQEQMWQNVALDRPLMQGVPEAAGQGLVLGGAMGGTIAGRIHNNKLTDGVNAIQYLSQQAQLDDAGKPIVDIEKSNAAFAALTALHPPATPERQTMDEWRADQLAAIAKGDQIDWKAFGAITTNQGLLAMAAGHIADVRARQDAAEQQVQTQMAVVNNQLPAEVMDDQGNAVPRQWTQAPTKQELAKAARLQKAVDANDAETLAREQGMLVRQDAAPPPAPTPTTVTPPAAAAPAATPPAAKPVKPTKHAGMSDAELSAHLDKLQNERDDPAVPASAKPSVREINTVLREQNARVKGVPLIPQEVERQLQTTTKSGAVKGMPISYSAFTDILQKFNAGDQAGALAAAETLHAAAKADPKMPGVAKTAYAKLAEIIRGAQGATNVQDTNVDQGAKPQPAADQAAAPVPQTDSGPDAKGDAASQPPKAAPQEAPAEVTPPKESTNEPVRQESSTAGSQGSSSGKVEVKPDTASQSKKRKSVRQKGAGDEGGDATPVRQEVAPKVRTPEDVAKAKLEAEEARKMALKVADKQVEDDIKAAKAQAKLETPEQAWDRIRGEKGTSGPRYTPTWAEMKEFIADTAGARKADNEAAEEDKLTAQQLAMLAKDEIRAKSIQELMKDFDTNRVYGNKAYANQLDLLDRVAEARSAPWREGYKKIKKEQAKAVKDAIEREALAEKIFDMIESYYRHDLSFNQKQQNAFMEVYKSYFKGNAKTKFDDAIKHAIDKVDLSKDAKGVTIPSIRILMAATTGTHALPALLDTISALSTSPLYKPLSAMMSAMGADGVKFVYKDELFEHVDEKGVKRYVRGKYTQATNTITIYKGGENPQTLLHEAVHALTVYQLGKAAQLVGKAANQNEVQALRGFNQLTELYSYLKAQPEMQGQYAFKNMKEFVAEVHTNPKLQAKLKEMQAPQGLFGKTGTKLGNLLQSFLDAVMSLLGLKPGSMDALSKALEVTTPYFAPNTAKNTAAIKQAGTPGTADAMMSPVSALLGTSQRAASYLKSMDKALPEGFLASKLATARKAVLTLQSTGMIHEMIQRNSVLSHLAPKFESFFTSGQHNSSVRNDITEAAIEGHLGNVLIALNKTKNPDRYRHLMGWLAGQASNLNLDLSKDFAGNRAANGNLDGAMKDHVDRLHREYMQLQNGTAEEREIAKLLKTGEKVNRLTYVMQIATLVRNALVAIENSAEQGSAAATALLNGSAVKGGKDGYRHRLDLLQEMKGATNTDPGKHFNAMSATLDMALTDLFVRVKTDPALMTSDLAKELALFEEAYNKGVNAPYMHLGRHGMYKVEFTVSDNGPQTTTKLEKLLKQYNVAIGPFHGKSAKVFLRVDNVGQAESILQAIKKSGLVKTGDDGKLMASANEISQAKDNSATLGNSRIVEQMRKRMDSHFENLAPSAKTAEAKAAFAEAMTAAQSAFLDMLEVNSARQANQARNHVPGYSTDYVQNFAKRAQWAVASISNAYTSNEYATAFREMQEGINATGFDSALTAARGQEIHDELARRFSNSYRPAESGFVQKMGVFGNNFYLALSPAYAIGNLMQPYMLTLPYLGGRFGFTKSAKGMAKASADTVRILKAATAEGWTKGGVLGVLDVNLSDNALKGLPADEIDFIRHLVRSGIVDSTQAHELGRMAEGDTSKGANIAKAASLFNHYTEVANRLSTGLVAYRLHKADPKANGNPTQYAIESIRRTQFDYSEQNTARAIGRHGVLGAATPLFMQFQRFAFFTMEHYFLMARDAFKGDTAAQKGLLGTLGAVALVSGTMGLPFVSAVVAVLDKFRGDDDDDKDLREVYREWLVSVFGKDMAELVAKGVLSRGVAGIDLTGSLGQQDLIPGSRFAADRREWKDKMKDQSKTMLGPAMNAGLDIYGGALHVADGDVAEGIKAMLPRALKGPAGAVKVGLDDGEFKDKSGRNLPIAASWDDYAKMGMGFTPAAKAEQSEANFMYQSQLYQRKQDKAKAEKQAIRAHDEGNYDEAAAILQEYTLSHPDNPIRNINATLQARARGQAIGAMTGIVEPNKRNLPLLQDYTGTYNYDQ